MQSAEEYKRMAVDAMVKYADNEDVYQLAQALEKVAGQVEAREEEKEVAHA